MTTAGLPSLYALSSDVAALLESEEEDALTRLDELLPALEHKAANVARWIQYQEDLSTAIRLREAKVVEARKAIEARAERAREYLKNCMERVNAWAITDSQTGTKISLQKNPPKVVVDDEPSVPVEFWRFPDPPPPALDRRALAAALKEGSVPGVHAEQTFRLVIK